MTDSKKIIVALDGTDLQRMQAITALLDPLLCRVKIGKEFFTATGPSAVKTLTQQGFEVFLDLKFHDIPHTVARACKAAADLGVWMVNVHALGGRAMLEAARDALIHLTEPPLLVAVTVLTSLDSRQLQDIGLPEAEGLVKKLAGLAYTCGLAGVVCSAQEAPLLKATFGKDFLLVTPGIRLATDAIDDQTRIMTPPAAIKAGADYLVIGRPITQSADPRRTLLAISHSIQGLV
jgi:orotidine-5'-phosphate decarboxylase